MNENPLLMADLWKAYYDARRHKRRTESHLVFQMELEHNMQQLYRELAERVYRPGPMNCFVVNFPVKREIFASEFRDRVVHHLYYNYVYPLFDRSFIHDSYSCRKGKGTLQGIERYEHHLRSVTDNYQRTAWVMKLDLQGYFMSIDRRRLCKVVKHDIAKYWWRRQAIEARVAKGCAEWPPVDFLYWLTDVITGRDPMKECRLKGAPGDWRGLPESKTLRGKPAGVGLPIGDLTSQLFSNVYLNRLDQYVKRVLRVRHYGRYVDDFFLMDADRRRLLATRQRIADYLTTIGLRLHPGKQVVNDTWRSTEFLGAVVRPHQRYCTRRTRRSYRRRIAVWHRHNVDFASMQATEHVRCVRDSYRGYFGHFRSARLIHRMERSRV